MLGQPPRGQTSAESTHARPWIASGQDDADAPIGQLADLRVYHRALTSEEAKDLFEEFSPEPPPGDELHVAVAEAINALCNVLNASGQQEKAEKLRPTSRPSTAAET